MGRPKKNTEQTELSVPSEVKIQNMLERGEPERRRAGSK